MLKGLFAPRPTRPDPGREAAERLKTRIRHILGLSDDDALTVSEIVCPDPACPGTETVFLIMRRGRKTEAIKIAKPVTEVVEQELRAALVQARFEDTE